MLQELIIGFVDALGAAFVPMHSLAPKKIAGPYSDRL